MLHLEFVTQAEVGDSKNRKFKQFMFRQICVIIQIKKHSYTLIKYDR